MAATQGLTWRRVEPEVVRDEGEESVGAVDELDFAAGTGLEHPQRLGQDGVARFDLLAAQLSERHLLGVDLKLDERALHLLDVEDHRDQLLDGLWQSRPEKRRETTALNKLNPFSDKILRIAGAAVAQSVKCPELNRAR